VNARSAWLLAAPLPAIAVGALASGRPLAFAPNVAAAVLGAALVFAVRRRARWHEWLPVAAAVLVAATLVAPDLEGVHRWLPLGPLRLHASAAFAPWLLFGLASEEKRVRMAALAGVVQAVHLAQPDAAQATALAAGAAVLLLAWPWRVAVPVLTALAVASWLRPDPLEPLEHVEGILGLTMARGPAWIAATAIAGALLFAPFALASRDASRVPAALALYLAAAFAVTGFGHFPVPVFGASAAPVLGWYGLVAILSAEGR
jgi:hypothetical protein